MTVAALLMLTIGCTGSVAEGVDKSPMASAARSMTPPSASSSGPQLSKVTFACRLPVTTATSGGDYVSYAGGFLSFPAATVQPDPTGGMHSRYLEGGFATDRPPVLYGSPQAGPPFYDAAQSRWVPASAAQSTSDGAFYAYGTGINLTKQPPSIRVVDVAGGTEKTFTPAAPGIETPAGFSVVDFDANGVYFMTWRGNSYGTGVWLLNPATGGVRVLTSTTDVLKVRGGFAWIGRLDPRDPSPPGGVPNRHLYNSIVRLDLQSGAEVTWYYNAGHSVWIKGLDSRDHPVVSVATAPDYPTDTSEIRLIDTPGAEGTIVYDGAGHSGTWSPEALWLTEPQADRDRLWFGSARGIYVYTPAGGLQKVLALPAPLPGAEVTIAPAGFCR